MYSTPVCWPTYKLADVNLSVMSESKLHCNSILINIACLTHKCQSNCKTSHSLRGGDSHVKQTGMLVFSLRRIILDFGLA